MNDRSVPPCDSALNIATICWLMHSGFMNTPERPSRGHIRCVVSLLHLALVFRVGLLHIALICIALN